MAVKVELKILVIGNEKSEGYQILQRDSWISFLHKFSRYNMQVTKQFAESFDGKKAQVENLTLFITKELIFQVTGLPQRGEKWFKKQHMDEKSWTL